MTGLPAARQTDMTLKGGPITQGSRTVYIGTSGGVACSVCPGGVAKGNPVNPLLGAKVQGGEVDVSLPGPLAFVVSRDYSSYQTDTPAPVGLLGRAGGCPPKSRWCRPRRPSHSMTARAAASGSGLWLPAKLRIAAARTCGSCAEDGSAWTCKKSCPFPA
ncbi:DUF6531 domain-containing protein [Diaphorobacter aerolatus]|uniref:DUF6531 domain-containing protein n=1 Tax=Diaphorobacter aerolatus TaxID=1288495 RepID=A0A7H0GM48_9BURK|nr:DUF6531 domain-containing protein [Diaphorobacter aerolatus]QNP49364.1 hypothetical protein H9K75_04740 [Diaphorobacter aerolatus]